MRYVVNRKREVPKVLWGFVSSLSVFFFFGRSEHWGISSGLLPSVLMPTKIGGVEGRGASPTEEETLQMAHQVADEAVSAAVEWLAVN